MVTRFKSPNYPENQYKLSNHNVNSQGPPMTLCRHNYDTTRQKLWLLSSLPTIKCERRLFKRYRLLCVLLIN